MIVWGCFSARSTGPLLHAKGSTDKHAYKNILIHHARPTLENQKIQYFQHENDPKHTAKTVHEYVHGKRWPAKVLEWPSQSPDLSPVEHLRSILDRNVRQRNKTISNISQLLDELNRAWAQLDKGVLKFLVHSMSSRCKAMIQS